MTYPCFASVLCRERDSNPHSRYGQGILSPSCLPFHHRGDLIFQIRLQK